MMPGFASTAAEGLFPPHVRTPEAALDYLSTWCDFIGGELLDGIEWDEIADTTGSLAVLRIPPFRLGFQGTGVRTRRTSDRSERLEGVDDRQDRLACRWRLGVDVGGRLPSLPSPCIGSPRAGGSPTPRQPSPPAMPARSSVTAASSTTASTTPPIRPAWPIMPLAEGLT